VWDALGTYAAPPKRCRLFVNWEFTLPLKPICGFFTVVFYDLEIFGCKTAQLCATRRECETPTSRSIRNGLQRCENLRNSLGLN
jgi:hypothetical protein